MSSKGYNVDMHISKALSWLLRHGALKEGLKISADGFVDVSQILKSNTFKNKYSVDDILRVVTNNDKQRFLTRRIDTGLQIRANQGHSISAVSQLELIPITDYTQFENIIHGTYFQYWNSIKEKGLHRKTRNHIHLTFGVPTDLSVVSGIRKSAEIYIYINLQKAFAEGLLFFLSSNKVVLSSGDREGYIKPKYFLKVYSAIDNSELKF